MKYKLLNTLERSDLIEKGDDIVVSVWPEFMLNDAVANEWFMELYSEFPEFQFWLLDEEKIVGIGNSIPIFWDKPLSELPDEGWDWALEEGFKNKKAKLKPNYVCGLSITMNPEYKGKGISCEMVKSMVQIAKRCGSKNLILPVRPSQKTNYPLVDIDEYTKWKKENEDLPFDAWLRVHAKLGGEINKSCKKAMVIKGSIADWRNWTGINFDKSGKYSIEGALTQIEIDIKNDIGTYIEPNVWVIHRV